MLHKIPSERTMRRMLCVNALVVLSLLYSTVCETVKENGKDNHITDFPICRNKQCRETAEVIKNNIDETAKPCDNFYSYACGGWTKAHMDKKPYDTFIMLKEKLARKLKELLEDTGADVNTKDVVSRARLLYKSCMGVPAGEEHRQEFVTLLRTAGFAEWPLETGSTMFTSTHDVLEKVGMSPILEFFVGKGIQKHTQNTLKLYPLSFSPMIQTNIFAALRFVKTEDSDSDLNSIVSPILTFEAELVKVMMASRTARHLPPFLETTVGELQEKFVDFGLSTLLKNEFLNIAVSVNDDTPVEIYNVYTFNETAKILQNANPITLFNYIGARFAYSWVEHASTKFGAASTKKSERWETCVNLVNVAMKEIVGHIFVKSLDDGVKAELALLLKKLKNTFEKKLDQVEWMDCGTKNEAKKKLGKMVGKIGYPKWLLDVAKLEALYQNVPNLTSGSFVSMLYDITRHNDRKNMRKLQSEHTSDSESLIYGAIGSILAHEISHAFAGRVSQFNADGIRKPWWSNETTGRFKSASSCFLEQYGGITTEDGGKLNTARTFDEDIADSGGLEVAFQAYRDLLQECEKSPARLPGLETMSGEQLFFLSYAQVWCSTADKEELKNRILWMQHSPNMYRVNLPVRNTIGFAEAYGCTTDSSTSSRTCSLWKMNPVQTETGK